MQFFLPKNYLRWVCLTPLIFQEMVKDKKLVYTFDATKSARFGVLPRYDKNESAIKWFELPNCFIFHNGDQLISCDKLLTCYCYI